MELAELGECSYDQGGYFIVNGGEKVLIAQEKMSNNHVYVFKKAQPSKYSYVAECRSVSDIGSKPTSTLYVKVLHKQSLKPNCIRCTIPYIREDIPVVIVFRALGFVADRNILERICYDFKDTKMLELLKPSLEEAFVIQDRELALDFIGKRGTAIGVQRERRIRYAEEVLQKELLPHIGTEEGDNTKKTFFFRLLYSSHSFGLSKS